MVLAVEVVVMAMLGVVVVVEAALTVVTALALVMMGAHW